MPRPPRISDDELLRTLNELGVSTTPQLALALDQHPGTLGKRITALTQNGTIHRFKAPPNGRRGHPRDLLVSARGLGPSSADERRPNPKRTPPIEPDPALVSHTLLLNELLARVCGLSRQRFNLCAAIRSSERYACLASSQSESGLMQSVRCSETGEDYTFEPDAAFLLSHRDEPRPLLFLIEADRGTEATVHQERGKKDFRHKVRAYQACFASGVNHHFAKLCAVSLCVGQNDAEWPVAPISDREIQGFRLLVLTHGRKRTEGLGRLVRAMPPSDFIWITEIDRLRTEGVAAPIWWPGGRTDRQPISILGKHALETDT